MALAERFTKSLRKKARRGFSGYPVATVAYYGPDDRRATKVAVAVIAAEGEEPEFLERWFADDRDVRRHHDINREILDFIRLHGARSVAMTDGIIGCPHEEGVDYPEGEACPHCPFWADLDRWTRASQLASFAADGPAEDNADPRPPPAIECQFITLDDAPPDYVIGFSCARRVYDQENDITLQRSLRYEPLMPAEERGVSMSVGYGDDRQGILEWVRIEGRLVELKAGPLHERRDCTPVDTDEWEETLRLLREMNRDGAFELTVG